ncbi:hypothetical protein N9C36_05185 [Candidatus Pelagibacter sp.]|nr:hypothetical protein [Candidatus Pelagibacter sp.]|tara:strand:+ start:447 stop:1127 length:681 start_codon:yes stop_codon:yes gene_type:complete
MKSIFLTTLALLFFNISAFSEDIVTKEINKTKKSLINTATTTKYILTPPKSAKKIIEDSIAKIQAECCEENFKYQKDLNEIKSNLEDCINKKCQNYMIPLFNVKKPPAKVLVLRQVELIDDLLMENEKQKYENLVSQMELDLGQKEKDQKKSMLKKEKNIESVKNQLLQIENENEKLKKTVNRMLTNYQKKISDLKKEKQILEDNFALVYEAHSKSKKKKLSEKLK